MFIEKVEEEELAKFFESSYAHLMERPIYFSLEKINNGWFVEQTFQCESNNTCKQGYMFFDFGCFYVYGGAKEIPGIQQLNQCHDLYCQFLSGQFGAEYTQAYQEHINEKLKEKERIEEDRRKQEASREKIYEYLGIPYKSQEVTSLASDLLKISEQDIGHYQEKDS